MVETKSSLRMLQKLRWARDYRKDLFAILDHVPDTDRPIRERMNWLADLVQWIRVRGRFESRANFESGAAQAVRVRYLLRTLENNKDWKQRSGQTMASILYETSLSLLFASTGLVERESFWSEVSSRVGEKMLPRRPYGRDFRYFIETTLNSESDVYWIQRLDDSTVQRLVSWVQEHSRVDDPLWKHLHSEEKEALLILSGHLRSMGFHPKILKRIRPRKVQENPFYRLDQMVHGILKEKAVHYKERTDLTLQIGRCRSLIREVVSHLDDFGVDTATVFLIDRMEASLRRFEYLWSLMTPQRTKQETTAFLADIVRTSHARRTLSGLFSDTFSLLAREISIRSAQTGERYITRSWPEFRKMFKKALGGGAVTALTTLIKFAVTGAALAGFVSGALASLNYAISFVIIHLLGWTLATKQPATTAPALASRMVDLKDATKFQHMIDEIIHLMRTQFIGVLGNVLAVVPLTALICIVYAEVSGHALISEGKAQATLKGLSVLGPTPLLAAWTGVLLWLSALIAAWVDNWFALHRLFRTLKFNRRLNFAFGEKRAAALAVYLKKNVAPLSGNISLGVLLGLTPAFMQFLGIPLDVRHVTLSAGAFAAAVSSDFTTPVPAEGLALAGLGILVIGIINILVSFFLALVVAIKARRIATTSRKRIFKAVALKFLKTPWIFIFPPRKKAG